ncbi:MAG TPA: hypothetical protein VE222_10375, partial [Nitrospiraceae bacterium]|nr:hypothetical protein [Nitrospiraceae bacterium]
MGLVGILALIIPAGVLAQTSTPEPGVTELQKQIQEMRSQMDKMQSRIDELEVSKTNAQTSPSAEPTASQNPSVPAESWRSLDSRMKKLEEPMA